MDKIINGIVTAEDVARFLDQAHPTGVGWMACCPAHDDSTPSLSISDGEKGIVVHCHGGCEQRAVITALRSLGAWPEYEKKKAEPKARGRVVAEYDYIDLHGEPLFQVVRFEPKDFRQRRKNEEGKWDWSLKGLKQLVPYRLHELVASKKMIFIVEGEKDADNAALKLDITATTFAQGAGKWREEYAQYFSNRGVVLLPDNDEVGKEHMQNVAAKLFGIAKQIKVIDLPGLANKQDVSDWIAAGGTKEKLIELISQTPNWQPKPFDLPPEQKPNPGQVVATDNDKKVLEKYGFISWPNQTTKGRPLSTIDNMRKLMDIYGISARYNVVRKDMEISIPDRSFPTDNAANCAIAEVRSLAATHELPVGDIAEYCSYIASENSYNPAMMWIDSKPWDGVNRFPELFESLDPIDREGTKPLLWRWMISAIAAVYNPNGVAARGMLVLQGEQYLGKTQWFWSLLNGNRELGREGVTLNPSDRDSVAQVISYWIVELGELDATFRRADLAQLKAFITKDFDLIRRPYARGDSRYPRRTILFGSVNNPQYLHDPTGNTRFWTVACGRKLNAKHGIDMQQMWAQVKKSYEEGARWMLTKEEMRAFSKRNEEFESTEPVEEKIQATFEWDVKDSSLRKKTATAVCEDVGIMNPTKLQKDAAARILRKLSGKEAIRGTGGIRVFEVPQRRMLFSNE